MPVGIDAAWLAGPLGEVARVFAPWEEAGWVLKLDSVLRRPMDASGGPIVRAMATGGRQAMVLAWNCEAQLVQAYPARMPYEDESGGPTLPRGYGRWVFVPGAGVTDALIAYFRQVGMGEI